MLGEQADDVRRARPMMLGIFCSIDVVATGRGTDEPVV